MLSQHGNQLYSVGIAYEGRNLEYICSCLSFAYHKNMCKHIYAVAIEIKDKPAHSRKRQDTTSLIPRGPAKRVRPQRKSSKYSNTTTAVKKK